MTRRTPVAAALLLYLPAVGRSTQAEPQADNAA